MRVWRICRVAWASTAFSGEGARRAGGRWNHKGTSVAYASTTLSLAALELFVNLDPEDAPTDLVAVDLRLPDDVTSRAIDASDLPPDWRDFPAPVELKDIGSNWVRTNKTLALYVPSVVIPHERNVLINPAHPDMSRAQLGRAEPFHFDPRMWK